MKFINEILNLWKKNFKVASGFSLLTAFVPPDESDFDEFEKIYGLNLDKWDRVKIIFSRNNVDSYHPDVKNAVELGKVSALAGFILGGIIRNHEHLSDFLRVNDAKLYINQREAHRMLAKQSFYAFVFGGLKCAPPFAVFGFSFSILSSCIQAYRNKIGILEFSSAGFIVGGLCRSYYGVKGIISGGIMGLLLGTFYGITNYALINLIGGDLQKQKYYQFMINYKAKGVKVSSNETEITIG